VGNGTSAGHSEQCTGNVGESQKFEEWSPRVLQGRRPGTAMAVYQ